MIAMSSEKAMSWVMSCSPLRHKDLVLPIINPAPSSDQLKERERKFVVDSISVTVFNTARKLPIIPPYNAINDKNARSYFRSPAFKALMERTASKERNGRLYERDTDRSHNKLSTRRRCKGTPPANEIRVRQLSFVNDAIHTERTRTKYHDIIPPYDANRDAHCRAYFQRKDVQRLLKVTLSPRMKSIH